MIIDYINTLNNTLKLKATHPSDIHILFSDLNTTHKITMLTTRKVEINTHKQRIPINLTIQISSITSDLENNLLTIRGRITKETENIRIRSFHNMTIGLNNYFTIEVEENVKILAKRLLVDVDFFCSF